MNDRYLCRAKRKSDKKWICGNLIQTDDGVYIIQNYVPQHLIGKYEVDPSTICQCTGLKDKNGKLIWENDIVKYHFGEEYAPIKYGVYQSCFDLTTTGHCGFYVDWPENINMRKDLGYWINMVDAEIVGNIFDNPELLEVGE